MPPIKARAVFDTVGAGVLSLSLLAGCNSGTMIGGAYVYGQNQHLAISFITKKMPAKFQPVITLFVEASVMIFSIVMLIMGGMNTVQNAVGQVSPALQMPMQYYYLGLPLGGVLFLLYSAFNLAELSKKNKQVIETK